MTQSDTDGCAINIDEEHRNEEDDDYIDRSVSIMSVHVSIITTV